MVLFFLADSCLMNKRVKLFSLKSEQVKWLYRMFENEAFLKYFFEFTIVND